MKGKEKIYSLLLLLLMALTVGLSLFYGGGNDSNDYIFREIRIPKTITAILAGSTLSVAGLVLQIIFRNPLAGPYVLGISSGSSLMVAITALTGTGLVFMGEPLLGKGLIIVAAVLGGLAVTFLILFLSRAIRSHVILLLVGLMISQICGAVQGALEYFANPGELKSFVMWGMGSISGTTNDDLLLFLPLSVLALFCVFFFVKPLQALLMGDNYASTSGINVRMVRTRLIVIASVLTGITTAFCGPIAFVGIAIPLLSRMLFHSSSQFLHLITSMQLGAILMLLTDVICHRFSSATLPVNMITTLVGAPLVIYMLFTQKRSVHD